VQKQQIWEFLEIVIRRAVEGSGGSAREGLSAVHVSV
jgi:hypothetical protein